MLAARTLPTYDTTYKLTTMYDTTHPHLEKEKGNRQKQKKRLKDGFLRHFSAAFENVRPEGFEPSTF